MQYDDTNTQAPYLERDGWMGSLFMLQEVLIQIRIAVNICLIQYQR